MLFCRLRRVSKESLKIRFRNGPPHIMGKIAGEKFVYKINGPENIMHNE
jgi:hypothetical protein